MTGAGADAGIDIVADGVAAQVKHWAKPVGREHLQRLRGASTAQTLVFFSLSGYSGPARTYGQQAEMALFQYDYAGRVQPLSPAASQLMTKRSASAPLRAAAARGKQEQLWSLASEIDQTARALSSARPRRSRQMRSYNDGVQAVRLAKRALNLAERTSGGAQRKALKQCRTALRLAKQATRRLK